MTLLADGSVSFRGGQNDAIIAGQIPKDCYRKAVNVTTDKGTLRPRPGYHHQEFAMKKKEKLGGLSYDQIINAGKFQAAVGFDGESGEFIIVAISGLLFRYSVSTLHVERIEFEVADDRMNQYRRRIPWSYAGKFLVFFDYPNAPVIVEGTKARRANRDEYEIPTAVLGTFNQNRLWIGNAQHEFGASDPVGGNPLAPITFIESLAPAQEFTGQFFSLGSSSQNKSLSYMGFLSVADSATGVGPLIVATKDATYAYRADLPRSEWENTVFGRMLLYNSGISGPRAAATLNSDLLFISPDNAVRSLFFGSSEQERWSNNPISKEVENWIKEYERLDLLDIAICRASSNRIYFGIAPHLAPAQSLDGREVFDYAHGALLVLELANVSLLGQAAVPAWAGIWTGINPMEMVNTSKGMMIFSKDSDGYNRVYLLADNSSVDILGGVARDITCRIYTREYSADNPFSDKQIRQVCYGLSEVEGDLRFKVEYRPTQTMDWAYWTTFEHKAETSTKTAGNKLEQKSRHSFRDLNLGDPEEVSCDKLTEDNVSLFRQIALRLTIKASFWQVETLRLLMEDSEETNRPSTKTCKGQLPEFITKDKDIADWNLYDIIQGSAVWA